MMSSFINRFLVVLVAVAAFLLVFFYFVADPIEGAVPADNPKIVRLKQRLIAAGISEKETKDAFHEAVVDPAIYEPKLKERWLYKSESVQRGKDCLYQYRDILTNVETRFMVEGAVIVSIHAVEVKFMDKLGDYRALDALLTRYLNEKKKKSDWLEQEIISWFLFCRKTKTSLFVPSSEWGATGPMQLMPSTALNYAIPAGSEPYSHFRVPDAFVSAANVLNRHGWRSEYSLYQPANQKHLLYRAYNKSTVYVGAVQKFFRLITGS